MNAEETPVLACSLDPDNRARQGGEWRALRRDALIDAREEAGVVTSTWKRGEGVAGRLEALVEAERICCSFLGFELEEREETLVLRVVSPAGTEPVAKRMLGLESVE
jgi:hypothetical protein